MGGNPSVKLIQAQANTREIDTFKERNCVVPGGKGRGGEGM